jgi:hypothetical protein
MSFTVQTTTIYAVFILNDTNFLICAAYLQNLCHLQSKRCKNYGLVPFERNNIKCIFFFFFVVN